ncbi:unnamed protein product [Gongylonema pulchrum]|uniref:PWWP domain-containing protein n=1 Tax=Gongylonema pulchrum TaxID=637853 RepID=A0A183EZQ1_9BILA|nr:unnamed protein product [Gongylonema pulchrum]
MFEQASITPNGMQIEGESFELSLLSSFGKRCIIGLFYRFNGPTNQSSSFNFGANAPAPSGKKKQLPVPDLWPDWPVPESWEDRADDVAAQDVPPKFTLKDAMEIKDPTSKQKGNKKNKQRSKKPGDVTEVILLSLSMYLLPDTIG